MNTKEALHMMLALLSEETKKLKKKKKKAIVSAPILKRPMGSIFYMDAAVSLNEGHGQKPVSKKFNHLKWTLNDFQKQFLDDFISIPDEDLKEEDFEYVSKLTGIPVMSVKSIKNTYADKKSPEEIYNDMKRISSHLGLGGHNLDQDTINVANQEFATARDLPEDNKGIQWSLNPKPHFRNQTPGETMYKAKHGKTGGLYKKTERELPTYMYEWLMYFIEGSTDLKITESKLMNDFNSSKFDKYKFVLFSFDVTIKESKAHAYDNMSTDSKLKELSDFRKKLQEFNEMFGTNFIIGNQYTGNDGFLKVVLENAQTTDGRNVYNREIIDMNDTDISKAARLGYYDQFTKTQTHRFGNDDDFLTTARSITG